MSLVIVGGVLTSSATVAICNHERSRTGCRCVQAVSDLVGWLAYFSASIIEYLAKGNEAAVFQQENVAS